MKRVFARIEDLTVGQILYDYRTYNMGNTAIRKEGCWTVRVVEIDLEKRRALCSWNGNTPGWYSERGIKRFRLYKKEAKL